MGPILLMVVMSPGGFDFVWDGAALGLRDGTPIPAIRGRQVL